MKEAQARQEAMKNAADELAEYLWAYKDGTMVLTGDAIWGEIWDAAYDRLNELRQQAAQERRLDQQAEAKGMRL